MQVITSKDNEIIKNIRKLKEKKHRDIANEYIIEGIKLIEEAIEENVKIKKIVVCEECLKDNCIEQKFLYKIAKYDCIYVTEKIFGMLTDVVKPQGILAVIEKDNSEDKIKYTEDIIVVLDGIQDPGNLGTILRTVDSARIKSNSIIQNKCRCIQSKSSTFNNGSNIQSKNNRSRRLNTNFEKHEKTQI